MNGSRLVLSLCASLLFLAGCGGSQPPIGAPGAMAQSRAITRQAGKDPVNAAFSRAKNQDLIYAMSGSGTYILSYRDGTVVGHFSQTSGYAGLCSDKHGACFYALRKRDIRVYPRRHNSRGANSASVTTALWDVVWMLQLETWQ